MRTDDFDFDLPPELIAERPAEPRDSARLLEVTAGAFADRRVAELPALLHPGDVMVVNDTRVIPARLTGRRGQARVEITLHKPVAEAETGETGETGAVWRAFARPAKKLRPGDAVDFGAGLEAEVLARPDGGEVTLRFDRPQAALLAALDEVGAMPLPPYIAGRRPPDDRDREDYQTVFAREPGAVAAPTAGLHFTPELLRRLDERGVRRVAVTLHVGAGTFLPVKTEDPAAHPLHSEIGYIDPAAAETINAARRSGGRVVAIGTTALRLLETAADETGTIHPFAGESDIFILPGYRFRAVDLLFTNFHLPRSTLFMLVCALAGTARMQAAYAHARAAGYRFYSYGDACLIPRLDPDDPEGEPPA